MRPVSAAALLGQIGRTGLLVLLLGGLIYGGVTWLADLDGAQFLLASALSLPLALFSFAHVVLALRSGSFPYGRREVDRSAEPRWFWGLVLFESGMAALLLWLGLWAVLQQLRCAGLCSY